MMPYRNNMKDNCKLNLQGDSKAEFSCDPGLFLDIKRKRDEALCSLGIVLRVTEAATKSETLQDLWDSIVTIMLEETDFENASLMLYDSVNDSLDLKAAMDISQLMDRGSGNYHKNLRFTPGEWVDWRVYESYSPVFIEDTENTPIPDVPNAILKPRCLVSLPLMGQGVLNLSSSRPREFDRYHKRDLVIVANVIGHVIQGFQLRDVLSLSHQHMQQMVEARTADLGRRNEELRSTLSYMECVIQNAPQGICLMAPDGTIRHANSSFLNMFDITPDQLAETGPEAFFLEKEDYRALFNYLEQRGVAQAHDVPLVRKDGETIPAHVFLHSIKGAAGEPQGRMLVIHDLREQKAITERFMQTEKLRALGTMAGGIAHDFNNLLTTILGNVELLSRDHHDPETIKRLKNIETAVNDGAHTVRRLQTFTAFGARRKSRDACCSPNRVIRQSIEITRPRWKNDLQKKGISVRIRTELSETPAIAMHESDLREVLTNLIFNAIDAMPAGGSITFRTSCVDEMVILEMKDTGTGIDPEIRQRIFDPFFTTKGVENSGLGLSISYGLVVGAGGKFLVESEPGAGTTFRLELPVSMQHISQPIPEPQDSADDRSLKILVVDDEEQIVDLLLTMLRAQGHEVLGFTNPEAALENLKDHTYDLILTDLGMPVVSGLDIASRARSFRSARAVALLTGWGAEYEQDELKEQGVDAVISKPFKFSELNEFIASLTGKTGQK